jgi:metal-responsive CopG/Arc/MetJ family transcriptional regulator
VIRTQIYLSEDEREAVNRIARVRKKSQSEIIRDAVDEYLLKVSKKERKEVITSIAGIWKDRTDVLDFSDIRRQWDRGLPK